MSVGVLRNRRFIERRTHFLLDGGKVFDHLRVWVVKIIRDKTHLNPTNELQLLLTQVERVARVDICKAGPSLGDFNAVKETLERIASSRAHDLLAIDVVSDMRIAGRVRMSVLSCITGVVEGRTCRRNSVGYHRSC